VSDAANVNGETPGEPQEASYDLPSPPTPEEAEAIERATNARPCATAFLVVIEPDGTAWATSDCNLDVRLSKPANVSDMYRACAEVMKDIAASTTAERTVNMMMQATAQMAEQQRQDKIAMKLASKGIHVPGR
jgi:hypothetical protein